MSKLRKIVNVLWNYEDARRGFLMGVFAILVYYTMLGPTWFTNFYPLPKIFGGMLGYYDEALAHSWVQPYGAIWYLLNLPFQNWVIYGITSKLTYIAIMIPQIRLAKQHKVSWWAILLNVMTAIFFIANQSNQDLTVIAFAPLATMNPWYGLLLVFQKMPFGMSREYWIDWFAQTRGNPWEITYMVLIGWFAFPLMVWAKKNVKWTRRRILLVLVCLLILVILLILRQAQHCVDINNGWVCHW